MELIQLKECLKLLEKDEKSFYMDIEDQIYHLKKVRHISQFHEIKKALLKAFNEFPLENLTLNLRIASDAYGEEISINHSLSTKNNLPLKTPEDQIAFDFLRHKIEYVFYHYEVEEIAFLGKALGGSDMKVNVDPKQIDTLD